MECCFLRSIPYKRFVWELRNIIDSHSKVKNIIFLCIGTTNVVGDSLGPVVGTVLQDVFRDKENISVIGSIKNIVTYEDIRGMTENIEKCYRNTLVIVIDSALSTKENIGKIFIQNRGLKYAESLGKDTNIIGNISIKAIVGERTNNRMKNFKNLREADINDIEKMSNIVSIGIIDTVYKK